MGRNATSHTAPAVCIYQRYLPPDRSGAGKQALTLAKRLQDNGHHVVILGDAAPDQPRSGEIDGLPVTRIVGVPEHAGHFSTLRYWLRTATAVLKLAHRVNAVQVHAVPFANPLLALTAKMLRKRLIVRTSLEGEFRALRESRFPMVNALPIRISDAVVTISQKMAEEYRDAGFNINKLAYIPNGVDTERFKPIDGSGAKTRLKRRLGLHDTVTLIYHGVFMERKATIWLVQALQQELLQRRWQLLLIGERARDDPQTGYTSRLKQTIARSPARDFIKLIGYRRNVERYLPAADAYILPSAGEGMSNALLEAMACGLVPIASETSGTHELIEDGVNGFLFSPNSPASLLTQLDRLDDAMRTCRYAEISQHAVRTICQRFSIDATATAYSRLYRSSSPSQTR